MLTTPTQLHQWLLEPEGQRLEFKEAKQRYDFEKLLKYCVALANEGGGAIVLGHLQLADRVHISAATVVTRSLTQSGVYTGMFPVDENAKWEKNAATLKQLHSMRDRIKALERQLQQSADQGHNGTQ